MLVKNNKEQCLRAWPNYYTGFAHAERAWLSDFAPCFDVYV